MERSLCRNINGLRPLGPKFSTRTMGAGRIEPASAPIPPSARIMIETA